MPDLEDLQEAQATRGRVAQQGQHLPAVAEEAVALQFLHGHHMEMADAASLMHEAEQ